MNKEEGRGGGDGAEDEDGGGVGERTGGAGIFFQQLITPVYLSLPCLFPNRSSSSSSSSSSS
jgi:hypothetical protein